MVDVPMPTAVMMKPPEPFDLTVATAVLLEIAVSVALGSVELAVKLAV